MKCFAFWLNSLLKTTVWYNACITAGGAPNHLSISRSIFPSLLNPTPEYLNYFTWGSNWPPTRREKFTVFRQGTMASYLEVLTLHVPQVKDRWSQRSQDPYSTPNTTKGTPSPQSTFRLDEKTPMTPQQTHKGKELVHCCTPGQNLIF